MKNNKLSIFLGLICCSILLLTSCKKDDEISQELDHILEFKVVNLPDDKVIYGDIDNRNNMITVNIPFDNGLLVIDPEIKLSEGAKLSEEVVPVNIESKNFTYTVLGSNGSSRTYTLNIVLGAPSTSVVWDRLEELNGFFYPNQQLPAIKGDFVHGNANLISLALINQDTQERFVVSSSSSYLIDERILRFTSVSIPADIVEGTYSLEVTNLGFIEILKEPLKIKYAQPSILFYEPLVIEKTAQWEIVPFSNVFIDPVKVTATMAGKEYELPIVSWGRRGIKVMFPEKFPTGKLGIVKVRIDFKEWKSISDTIDLTLN